MKLVMVSLLQAGVLFSVWASSDVHAAILPRLEPSQPIVASEVRERAFGGATENRNTGDQARFLCVEYDPSSGECKIYQWILLLMEKDKGYYRVANSIIRNTPAPATPEQMANQLLMTKEYRELVDGRKLVRSFEFIELWRTCVFDYCTLPAPFVLLSILGVPVLGAADVVTLPAKMVLNVLHRQRVKAKIKRYLRTVRDNQVDRVFQFNQNVFENSMPMLGI